MRRRTFLASTGIAAGTTSLARPAIAQPAAARTLRYVPQADLANGDPVWTTATVAYGHAALVQAAALRAGRRRPAGGGPRRIGHPSPTRSCCAPCCPRWTRERT